MPVLPVEIGRFGGLDLANDSQEIQQSAAVDMLNVDLDQPGRMRSRDGYANFTTSAAAGPYLDLQPYYRVASATRQLVAGRTAVVEVLNTSGGVISGAGTSFAPDAITPTNWSLVRFGSPTTELVFCLPFTTVTGAPRGDNTAKWNGTTFNPAGVPPAAGGCMQTPDNRLAVIAGSPTADSTLTRMLFSDAGAPETFSANNFVDLSPGDGEWLRAPLMWRNQLFVFKDTRFFTFYGNSVDGSGNPIFNYNTVHAGIGCVGPRAAVAAPQGVYLIDRTGVYITQGGPPALVSQALNPLFGRAPLSPYYSGSAINWAQIQNASISYYNGRLYVSLPTGVSTTNDRTFVLDVATNQWMVWDFKVNDIASFRIADQEEMVFSIASGSNHVGRWGQSYTTDAGTSITSKYRTGFITPAVFSSARTRRGYPWPGAEGVVREWLIEGQGTVTVKTAYNDSATLGTGASVTLGTAPVTSEGRDRRAVRGRNVSVEISGSAPWQTSRVIANVQSSRGPGNQAEA